MMNVFCDEPTKDLRFIGVTGTNGKTSVAAMLKNIFDEIKHPSEVIGTLNCSSFRNVPSDSTANFTTPDPEELFPLLRRMRDGGVKTVIMEASSHALKLQKLAPITFEVGIFTNLTEDHLDFHSDMEDYLNSKLCLFYKSRLGIINTDDEYGKRIASLSPCEIMTCSMEQEADFSAFLLEPFGAAGTRYKIRTANEIFEIFCSVPGKFSVLNSMQAVACAHALNIDKNILERSFKSFFGVEGRLEKSRLFEGRGFAVFIDYAHTPDALSKLLDTVNSFKEEHQRTVLVFGCGGDRERQKRSVMGMIASKKADFVIVTSDNPRSENPNLIINDIMSGLIEKSNFAIVPDRRAAIEFAIATARRGDIILLAGKGHERYEINSFGKIPFDEREILRDIHYRYYGREIEL
jgi:UDP-N-acetylmuramoyl-L-alanyl-D-glutamate--2,6-diaminopimelate ligase